MPDRDGAEQREHRGAKAQADQHVPRVQAVADSLLRECGATCRHSCPHQGVEIDAQAAEGVVGGAGESAP